MRFRPHWAAVMAVFLCLGAEAADTVQGLPETVVRALVKAKIPPASFSVQVQEIGADKPLLAYQADTPRNPASTIKLLTTFLGLEALGPTYVWKTTALSRAAPRGGVLDGDLYLKGYGDPYLVLERFWLLVRELRLRGVREIRGDLVIDNTFFDVGGARPGDFDGRPYSPYNLVPDALLVNFQSVNFMFRPDPAANRVEILADPLPANLRIRNQVQLVDGRCTGRSNRINFTVAENGGREEATFTGRFSRQCGEYRVARSLLTGPSYAYGLFRALWEESGGTIRGHMRVAPADPALKTLARLESVPLADVITGINKFSNNVMARHLLLTLGAERFGAPATVEKGQRAAAAELARLGLSFPELDIGNGAGLARETRISARSLTRVLLAAESSPFSVEFESSLALPGLDGTLRRRFRNEDFTEGMHLKTGTLNGVRALAGYVRTRSGRKFAVTMIQNANGWGDEAQAAMLRWVYQH
ncbi:MAG: D-alanyl-D-alanine carboxypeptidase/D-alanyl-D-alanine-endopeptidase [Gammaproteobacteria bacterium]|nr:MAG: D-alanyl-D-alanine carboxypeptidase/D-alanyl-D-alanine-endopeptidase [Gammaproteobacteria bacterium]